MKTVTCDITVVIEVADDVTEEEVESMTHAIPMDKVVVFLDDKPQPPERARMISYTTGETALDKA